MFIVDQNVCDMEGEGTELDRGEGDQQHPWEVLEHRQPIRAVLAWDGRPGPLCPCHYQLYVGCPERKGMPFDEATICRKAHQEGAGSRRQ